MRHCAHLFEAFQLHGLTYAELARGLYRAINDDNALGLSAQLAFYTLLSVFPFLIFLLTLVAYLPIPNLTQQVLGYVNTLVPGQAAQMVQQIVLPIVAHQNGGLLTGSIIGAVWSASSALNTFFFVMDQAYEVPETRSWARRQAVAIALTLALSVLIVAAAAFLVVGPEVAGALARRAGLGEAFSVVWLVVKWPAVFILVSVTLAILYYFAPDARQRWCWITPGSVLATLLWIVFSLGFAFYVRNFGAYNKVYGFLGALVVLMLWLYLTSLAAIIGAELNSELDRAAKRLGPARAEAA